MTSCFVGKRSIQLSYGRVGLISKLASTAAIIAKRLKECQRAASAYIVTRFIICVRQHTISQTSDYSATMFTDTFRNRHRDPYTDQPLYKPDRSVIDNFW